MAVGPSGRIVVEIDPQLKQELYAALEREGISLRQWFLSRVNEHLRSRVQMSLDLRSPDENGANRACKR
jgi:hypothetical protein